MNEVQVDFDSFLYRAGFAAEHKEYICTKDGEEEFRFTDKRAYKKFMKENPDYSADMREWLDREEEVIFAIWSFLMGIQDRFKGWKMNVYIEGEGNFREQIADYYKANRKNSPKPYYYPVMIEYVKRVWGAIVAEGVESDDMAVMAHKRAIESGANSVLVHIDKDLDTAEGFHMTYSGETYVVGPLEAERNFYMQLLTGDTADNIPGIHRVGPVKADQYLPKTEDFWGWRQEWKEILWGCVLDRYAETDTTYDEIIQRATLLRMLEYPDYEWTPPF